MWPSEDLETLYHYNNCTCILYLVFSILLSSTVFILVNAPPSTILGEKVIESHEIWLWHTNILHICPHICLKNVILRTRELQHPRAIIRINTVHIFYIQHGIKPKMHHL